jgi:hypothetical protein
MKISHKIDCSYTFILLQYNVTRFHIISKIKFIHGLVTKNEIKFDKNEVKSNQKNYYDLLTFILLH